MERVGRLLFILVLGIAGALATNDCHAVSDCIYSGVSFSDGAISCQSGRQFQCVDGDWKALDVPCSNPPPTPTVVNPEDCSCTENEVIACDRQAHACCVSLDSGKCTKRCCPR